MTNKPLLLAFVGMPGSGKSRAVAYLSEKNVPHVRFGDVTDDALAHAGLSVTAENEKTIREALRKEHGMTAYAVLSLEKIKTSLATSPLVVIDGLYSWEEYLYLREQFERLVLVQLYVQRSIRYQRLAERTIRPLTTREAQERDFAEIDKLNKGGPIALADYLIDNTSDDLSVLEERIDAVLGKLESK